MAKNLKEFIQCGRDPAYLKNGDIVTEELAWEIVGQDGYADGCLDQEFEITQSHIVEATTNQIHEASRSLIRARPRPRQPEGSDQGRGET